VAWGLSKIVEDWLCITIAVGPLELVFCRAFVPVFQNMVD